MQVFRMKMFSFHTSSNWTICYLASSNNNILILHYELEKVSKTSCRSTFCVCKSYAVINLFAGFDYDCLDWQTLTINYKKKTIEMICESLNIFVQLISIKSILY